MGGRSKQRDSLLPDSFSWLREVSDDRLNRYGKAGRARYLAGSEDAKRKTGVFEAVWDNAAIEYKSRFGVDPDWSPNNTPHRFNTSAYKVNDSNRGKVYLGLSEQVKDFAVMESSPVVYSGTKRGYASKLVGMNYRQISDYKSNLESQISSLKMSKDGDKYIKLKRLRREYSSTAKVLDSMG